MAQDAFLDMSTFGSKKNALNANQAVGEIFSGCEVCPLLSSCHHPKMQANGKNLLQIMVIGESPDETDDRCGIPFVGRAGQSLRAAFKELGVDLAEHCRMTNVIQCRTPGNKFPSDPGVINRCGKRLNQQIIEAKPKLIYAVGAHAINALLRPPFAVSMEKMHGFTFPSQQYNCWICCIYHPAYIMGDQDVDLQKIWKKDIEKGLMYLERPIPQPLDLSSFEILTDVGQACEFLLQISELNTPIAFDYETTCLNPFDRDARMLTLGIAPSTDFGVAIPIDHPEHTRSAEDRKLLADTLRVFFTSNVPKVIQNSEFERIWTRRFFGVDIGGNVWDTMICNHILDDRADINSLQFQVFRHMGIEFKFKVDYSKMAEESMHKLCELCASDARYELWIYEQQLRELHGNID